jgi:hypothetical protein
MSVTFLSRPAPRAAYVDDLLAADDEIE